MNSLIIQVIPKQENRTVDLVIKIKICAYIFFLHIASYCGQVCVLILGYLKHICRDDIVGVERHENVIGSALSILGVIFGLWDEHMNLLQTGKTNLMSSALDQFANI